MTNYGYRVFVLELFPGMGRKSVDFAKAGGSHYQTVAAGLLSGVRDRIVLDEKRRPGSGDPDILEEAGPASDSEPALSDPLIGKRALALEVLGVQETLLYGEVLVGKYGDHESALGAPQLEADDDHDDEVPEPHLSLTGRAPARRFRFVFNFPATGKQGIVVVEDISRSCPIEAIVRLLRYRSQDSAKAAPAPSSDGPGPAKPWWRPVVTAAVDDEHFNQMIEQGKLQRLELVRHRVASDGQRHQEELRLTAPRPEELTSGQELVALVRQWVEQARRRHETPRARSKRRTKEERAAADLAEQQARRQNDQEAATAMAALLGEEVKSLDFDDGWLVVQDGDRTKKISPSRISELFTYQLQQDRRPSNLEWYRAARGTALRLATPLKINLEWPTELTVPGGEDQ